MTSQAPPYPRQPHEGRPEKTGRQQLLRTAALVLAAGVAGTAVLAGLGYGLLRAVDPMGDEWVCSAGEAPVIALNDRATMTGCVAEGTRLPEHVVWHPFGNRPMPYNCDEDGWVLVERTARRGDGRTEEREQDCVRETMPLPGGWEAVTEG